MPQFKIKIKNQKPEKLHEQPPTQNKTLEIQILTSFSRIRTLPVINQEGKTSTDDENRSMNRSGWGNQGLQSRAMEFFVAEREGVERRRGSSTGEIIWTHMKFV